MTDRIEIRRTTARDPDFIALIGRLDAELWRRYGEAEALYAVHNQLVTDTSAVVAYVDDVAGGCGSFRRHHETTAELKRMFVAPEHRRAGLGRAIVGALETWALEQGYTAIDLETGTLQPEAVRLYESHGYLRIENYPPYVGMPQSICMRKLLR